MREKIITEIADLKTQLHGAKGIIARKGFDRLLNLLEEKLTSGEIEKDELKKISFAIIRSVGDSYEVEKTSAGQDLLRLHRNLNMFIKSLE